MFYLHLLECIYNKTKVIWKRRNLFSRLYYLRHKSDFARKKLIKLKTAIVARLTAD